MQNVRHSFVFEFFGSLRIASKRFICVTTSLLLLRSALGKCAHSPVPITKYPSTNPLSLIHKYVQHTAFDSLRLNGLNFAMSQCVDNKIEIGIPDAPQPVQRNKCLVLIIVIHCKVIKCKTKCIVQCTSNAEIHRKTRGCAMCVPNAVYRLTIDCAHCSAYDDDETIQIHFIFRSHNPTNDRAILSLAQMEMDLCHRLIVRPKQMHIGRVCSQNASFFYSQICTDYRMGD